jgi:hypothetical protein
MADWLHLQQGDLDDAASVTSLVGHMNLGDYVHNGLQFQNFDWTNGSFDVTSGKAFKILSQQYANQQGEYRPNCLVAAGLDARTDIPFDPTQLNYIYLDFNVGTNDSPTIETDTTAQSVDDWLKIAEIDPNATQGSRVTRFNEAPDITADDANVENLFVGDSITYPDGTTRTTAPLSSGSILNNKNNYYDDTATDPAGKVRKAAKADQATHASSANSATHADDADYADEAGKIGPYDKAKLDEMWDALHSPWEKITPNPIIDIDIDTVIDIDITIGDPYDRYLCTFFMENQHDDTCRARATVNNHIKKDYHQSKLFPPNFNTSKSFLVENTKDHWSVGEATANSTSVEEFEITVPKATDAAAEAKYNYPSFSMHSQATSPTNSREMSGHVTRKFTDIDSIQIKSDNPATGRAVVWGQNIE